MNDGPRNNPFLQSIVADPWDQQVTDVPQIHARAFHACRAAFDQVRQTGSTQSVLVHGEPGSGKTHLLARLRNELSRPAEENRARENGADATHPPLPPAIFSSLRLRSGSRMICRHVRRALTSDLLRPVHRRLTQLDWLLIHRAAPHVNKPAQADRWYLRLRFGRTTTEAERAAERDAEELLRRLSRDLRLPGNLSRVLSVWALGRNPRAVRDWLAEGTLPDAELDALGLLPMPEDSDPEEEALDLIEALSRLAGPGLPLVLCFDQVEALQTHVRDLEGPFAFGRMISALHDRTRNTLLITGVQSTFLETLQNSIRAADLDRLRETMEVLEPLDANLAPVLAAARLDDAPQFAGAPQRAADPCWPIGSDAIRQFVTSSQTAGCTPRRLIAFCRQKFDAWRTGRETPPPSAEQFLADQFESLFERALQSWWPSKSDEILNHGLPLVLVLAGLTERAGDTGGAEADWVLSGPRGSAAVSLCNETGNRLTGRLKRIRQSVDRHGSSNRVLLRDARIPISPNARKAREHLDALAKQGVPLIRPSAEAVAALDALRALLSDAKSGDLAADGETIAEHGVRQWLTDHLPDSVQELVDQIVRSGGGSEEPAEPVDPSYDALLEAVQHRHVARLAELAEHLHCDLDQLTGCLARHRDRFGVLSGPPTVVFERVETAPTNL